ncbi:MAG: hypothetical protein ABL931_19565 [Usitatibacteraceae bacterium]
MKNINDGSERESGYSSLVTICLLIFAAIAFWLLSGLSQADAAPRIGDAAESGSAPALQAQYLALKGQLDANAFQRPLVLESRETSKTALGDVYAIVPHSFENVRDALAGPQAWCEVLILHLNTKFCKIARQAGGTTLLMNVGKKYDQPLADSFRLSFAWELVERTPAFLRIRLSADEGPLGTHDYRMALEAIPLENGQTFLHLSYSYGFGMTGKIAMMAYLNTLGRSKVGFTVTGNETGGQPIYIGGMRGLVERNTMRYHLAIESFLGALATPPRAQFEKRINDWFTAIERYPRQLHEMEQADYLEMKRKEYTRQQLGMLPLEARPA